MPPKNTKERNYAKTNKKTEPPTIITCCEFRLKIIPINLGSVCYGLKKSDFDIK